MSGFTTQQKQELMEIFSEVLKKRISPLENKADSFYSEFIEFKEKSYTFFDNFTQQLEDLKIEYDFIKHQMREYDDLLQNPEKTEDERYVFWKNLSQKVTALLDKVAALEKAVYKKQEMK